MAFYRVFRQARGRLLEASSRADTRNCETGRFLPTHHTPSPTPGSESEPMESMRVQGNLNAIHLIKTPAPVVLALTIAFLSLPAMAETPEERQACIGDAFRVCWAAIPNRNDVFRCLMDNRPRLNPACRVVMDQYRRPHRITRHTRTTARVE